MPVYEYKVVPAPEKGQKAKGIKGTRERFALTLESLMNELGAEGWEYVRADMLPCEERSGLTGSATVYQNLLVFRRETTQDAAAPAWQPAKAPAAPRPAAEPANGAEEPGPEVETGDESASKTEQAAAAAAAALTAFRKKSFGNAPKLGPAPRDD